MSESIVVGYDGTEACRRAVELALKLVKVGGGKLVVAHVLEWSPFSFLTPEELEERHMRRRQELTLAEERVMGPLIASLKERGVDAESEIRYGNVADTLSEIAVAKGGSQILVGRTGSSSLTERVFGSSVGALVQTSPVPVTVVP